MLRTFVSTGTFCQRLKCSRTRHNLKPQVQSSANCKLQCTLHRIFHAFETIGHRCGLESWSTYYYLQSYRRCLFRNLGRSIRSPGCHKNRFSGCNASMPLRQNVGTAGTHNGKSWTRSGGQRGPTGRRTNPTISPESSSLTSQRPTPNVPLPHLLFTFQSTNCLHVHRTVVRRTQVVSEFYACRTLHVY